MSKTRICPNCGAKMPDEMRFCGRCGTDLDYPDREQNTPRPVRRSDEPRPVETARVPAGSHSRGSRVSPWQHVLVILIILMIIAVAVVLVLRMNRPAETPAVSSPTTEPVHVINANGEEIGTESPVLPAPSATPTPAPSATPEAGGTPSPSPTPTATPAPSALPVTEANDTVYVTGSTVNLRIGPGTDYNVGQIVSAGTELHRTGKTSGWSRVQYEGSEYYISNELISEMKPTPEPYTVTSADDTVVVVSDANVRTGPATSYEVIGMAPAGTQLHRTGRANGWSQVQYNGAEGFIYESLLGDPNATPTPSPTPETIEVTESQGSLTVREEANIRSGPGTDYEIVGKAAQGEILTMVGYTSNHWYIIAYNGEAAYINGNMVIE